MTNAVKKTCITTGLILLMFATVNVSAQNFMDHYLFGAVTIEEIAGSTNGIQACQDLAFNPLTPTTNELWVLNKGNVNSGGSIVTLYNPGKGNQTSLWRSDGNAWHFMSLPTALAFSPNGNFATSPGVFDANHNNTTFTGPSLWSSDSAIFANVSGGGGSHLDMLHQSPYSQGIESETANKFWVFDGYYNNIVQYDFVNDHGPGNANHLDGILRRYTEVVVAKDPSKLVPSHMRLDAAQKWLYIVDNGNQRVLRMDITSGTVGGNLASPYESFLNHKEVTGVTYEDVVTTGLNSPCGIDVLDDRMIVSDNDNGDILIYSLNTIPAMLMGIIQTGSAGVMGVAIGPDKRIWYVNYTLRKVFRLEPTITSIPEVEQGDFNVYPNPNNNNFTVEFTLPTYAETEIYITDITGRVTQNLSARAMDKGSHSINFSTSLPEGIYFINIKSANFLLTRKLVIL
ncbi:MAG: T9SS type A sorting domain-containing protein [Bacteroidetes bacterium]|nr:T9SS type A sorting domain-containing protein [Bacteroidota bacterium]